mmetsp:Transcript_37541/g.87638  ORF Transcript_37541/g.87638 Transcript_37541/m.87638 type:complete len:271 (+) Transcript_37541:1286-2098(+)
MCWWCPRCTPRVRRRRSTSSSSTTPRKSPPSSASLSRPIRRPIWKPAWKTTRSPNAWTPAVRRCSAAATTKPAPTKARWKTACSTSMSGIAARSVSRSDARPLAHGPGDIAVRHHGRLRQTGQRALRGQRDRHVPRAGRHGPDGADDPPPSDEPQDDRAGHAPVAQHLRRRGAVAVVLRDRQAAAGHGDDAELHVLGLDGLVHARRRGAAGRAAPGLAARRGRAAGLCRRRADPASHARPAAALAWPGRPAVRHAGGTGLSAGHGAGPCG